MNNQALLLENIHENAHSLLAELGFEIRTDKKAWKQEDFESADLASVAWVGLRSKTQIRSEILKGPLRNVQALGTYCIGTDQVDLLEAQRLGIPVFNAPYSNTRSVAELVLCELVALSRKLFDLSLQTHQGKWNKTAVGSHEVRGKTLGIVGYGHIGTQVSILAEAFGMRVKFFDIVKKLALGNAESCESLSELLAVSDFVTLHVPDTLTTRGMFGLEELNAMRPGSFLLNLSRGTVVDLNALKASLESGHLAGAAIDVYPVEPEGSGVAFESELLGLKNVILTPHIGGSTEEAQASIGSEVSASFHRYWTTGSTLGSVNFPELDVPLRPGSSRILHVHKNRPGALGEVNQVFSKLGLNVVGQYLGTTSEIGYLISDFDPSARPDVCAEARSQLLDSKDLTIRCRLIGG